MPKVIEVILRQVLIFPSQQGQQIMIYRNCIELVCRKSRRKMCDGNNFRHETNHIIAHENPVTFAYAIQS